MEYVQNRTDLDVIAITDHNTIEGALFARSLQELYDFEVIVGEEVSSRDGHVLGLFLEEHIPAGMSARDTVRAVKDQGGIAILPHPFSAQGVFGPTGIGHFDLAVKEWGFDGFEVFNSLPFLGWANSQALKKLESGQRVAATGGSDAHLLQAIGKCHTLFEGTSAEDLRAGIENVETEAHHLGHLLRMSLRYVTKYHRIRHMQSWNWERCKA
jgi:predicted metal-dependent phosphoesterase TrpH